MDPNSLAEVGGAELDDIGDSSGFPLVGELSGLGSPVSLIRELTAADREGGLERDRKARSPLSEVVPGGIVSGADILRSAGMVLEGTTE